MSFHKYDARPDTVGIIFQETRRGYKGSRSTKLYYTTIDKVECTPDWMFRLNGFWVRCYKYAFGAGEDVYYGVFDSDSLVIKAGDNVKFYEVKEEPSWLKTPKEEVERIKKLDKKGWDDLANLSREADRPRKERGLFGFGWW